ncbi:MAG: ABC transporter substrate-binding protein [Acidobacteria bacterium]|nr:ABC transporter substrate-binding protein [Acidobacteriota bacterium]
MKPVIKSKYLVACLALIAAVLAGCGRSRNEETTESSSAAGRREAVSTNKDDYPVFIDPDSGADPSVPAEQGGKGFAGEDWETNTDFELIGDPRAVQGGLFREYMLDFPGTLRVEGPESNTTLNSMIQGLVYETLLIVHPTTLDFIPALATHWQISSDKTTYRYRIDPNARWSDGRPVTAEDVVASWSFYMDKGLQAPMAYTVWSKFERPVAESKYLVRVKSGQLNWRNFLYFSASLPVLPAHVLKNIDGAAYLRDYNFRLLPGSGPYVVREEDIKKGRSVSLRRRNDYWAEKQRRNVGLYNFGEIREIVVRDENLAFEMFKKGDLDQYYVARAKMWVEELDFDNVGRGLIQKRKIFNNNPNGVQGFAFNTRRAPYSDIRVRKALTFLLNRELMIQKLFYNEYVPLNSYYAGSVYENPNNPQNRYDPELALKLLSEAGWKERDRQGRLVNNGRPFQTELLYSSQTQEPYLTVYQEDLRKAGISLNLRLVTGETLFKQVMDRSFDLASIAWSGLLFPNPETSYLSSLADVKNSNNITGIKSQRIDQLLGPYDKSFDIQERIKIIREVDGILAQQYHYILTWYGPYQRIAFWNKFGTPQAYISRIGDYRDMVSMWWIEPEKEQKLRQALRDSSARLEAGPTEDRTWLEYARTRDEMKLAPNR